MVYVGIIVFFWVFSLFAFRIINPTVITSRIKPKQVEACPYCKGDSLILTYYKDFVGGPKCREHMEQWNHIADMENQFFGPPLKVLELDRWNSTYWDTKHGFERAKPNNYVNPKEQTIFLNGDRFREFNRVCAFLANSGYTVNLRLINAKVYYEILDSLGQFAEIGVFEEPSLGFKLPTGPKPNRSRDGIKFLNEKISNMEAKEEKELSNIISDEVGHDLNLDEDFEYQRITDGNGTTIKIVRTPRARYLEKGGTT